MASGNRRGCAETLIANPRPHSSEMLAQRGFSTQETTTKRLFATKGEANGQMLWKPESGAVGRTGGRGADRRLPGLGLFNRARGAFRRSQRPRDVDPAMAPRLLRCDV